MRKKEFIIQIWMYIGGWHDVGDPLKIFPDAENEVKKLLRPGTKFRIISREIREDVVREYKGDGRTE